MPTPQKQLLERCMDQSTQTALPTRQVSPSKFHQAPGSGDPGQCFHAGVAAKLSELTRWLQEFHEAEVSARLRRQHRSSNGQGVDNRDDSPRHARRSLTACQLLEPCSRGHADSHIFDDAYYSVAPSSPEMLPMRRNVAPPSPEMLPMRRRDHREDESSRPPSLRSSRPPSLTSKSSVHLSDHHTSFRHSQSSAIEKNSTTSMRVSFHISKDHDHGASMDSAPSQASSFGLINSSLAASPRSSDTEDTILFEESDLSSIAARSRRGSGITTRVKQFKMLRHWNASRRTLSQLRRTGAFALTMGNGSVVLDKVPSMFSHCDTLSSQSLSCLRTWDACLSKWVVHPSARSRTKWILFSLFLWFSDVLFLPLDVFLEADELGHGRTTFAKSMNCFITVFLTLDVFLNFFTGKYLANHKRAGRLLTMDFCSVALWYAKTWLLPDLVIVASTWLDLAIIIWNWNQHGFFHSFIHYVRIVRIANLVQPVHATLHNNMVASFFFHELSVVAFCLLILLHALTCAWYVIGRAVSNGWATMHLKGDCGWIDAYIISTNSLMAQVAGVHAGEAGPPFEGGFVAVMRLLLVFLTAWLTAKLTVLTINLKDQHAITMRLTCTRYLMRNRISTELSVVAKQCLVTQLRKRHQGEQVEQEADMISVLPDNLQAALHEEARGPVVLMSFKLLNDLLVSNSGIVQQICHKAMTNTQGLAGDNIFGAGDMCTRMYFVNSGKLYYKKKLGMLSGTALSMQEKAPDNRGSSRSNIMLHENSIRTSQSESVQLGGGIWSDRKCVSRLRRGDSIAEPALWTTWRNYGNLRASTDCTVLSLHSHLFVEAIPYAATLLYITLYARAFVRDLNETFECDRCDTMTVAIPPESVETMQKELFEDKHVVFLSHYKLEAGTEATLMKDALERMIEENEDAPSVDVPIFVDSENLQDLSSLRCHVSNSHNLVLLLTPGVLSRPWCLVEIVTAVENAVAVVPVELQRPGDKFEYPDEGFYKKLRSGKLLSAADVQILKEESIDMSKVEEAIRLLFLKIALPFSPHGSANVRNAELVDILTRCLPSDVHHDSEGVYVTEDSRFQKTFRM